MRALLLGWIKKILGHKSYINLRSTYSFRGSDSPFPLHSQEDFEVNWDLFKKPEHDNIKAVYIISPTQRSGTNFLNHLLMLHPGLYYPESDTFPPEQCLYSYIEDLKKYSYKTVTAWNKWTRKSEKSAESQTKFLMNEIGGGILNYYLTKLTGNQLLLLKTPDAGHVEDYFHLFPNTKVILLIRDGRDTVSSFLKSWGGEGIFKKFSLRWKNRMDSIETFLKRVKDSGMRDQVITLKYDKLNSDNEHELKRIFKFLGLDEHNYPWDKLGDIPVLGSSSFKGGDQNVHWKPIPKNDQFKPNEKWKTWSPKKKKIFKKIAGDQLVRFGFAEDNNW